MTLRVSRNRPEAERGRMTMLGRTQRGSSTLFLEPPGGGCYVQRRKPQGTGAVGGESVQFGTAGREELGSFQKRRE